MASLINIRTNEGSLDLPKDFDSIFYVTRQIFDITDFETRNADFTKSIQAPATPRNIRILGALADIANSGEQTDNRIQCSIEMAGITIAPVAWILHSSTLVTSVGTFFKLFIMYGNFNMFDQLSGQTIDKLNWADTATTWETADLLAKSTNTYLDNNIVYPLADWNTRESLGWESLPSDNLNNKYDANITGFFIYARTIIERMLTEANYTLVVGTVPADFNTIALACPVTRFCDIEDVGQLSLSNIVINNIDQTSTGTTDRGEFQTVITGSNYNLGLNQFLITTAIANLRVQLTGVYDYIRGHPNNPASIIGLYQNAVLIASIDILATAANVPFFIFATVNTAPNDIFYVQLEADNTNAPAILTMEINAEFAIYTAGADVNRLVQPSEHIPQITQSTFLANILKLFNLFMVTDDIEHTVTLNSFDTIYQNTEIDLSNQIAGGKNDAEISNSIASIGQQTSLKWQEDNLLRRDANTTLEFDNQILAKEVTVIDMLFSACDNSVLYFDTINDFNFKAKIPMLDIEINIDDFQITILIDQTFTISKEVPFQVGSYLMWNSIEGPAYFRVTAKTSSTTGSVTSSQTLTAQSAHSTVRYPSTNFEPRLAILSVDGNESGYILSQGDYFVGTNFPIGAFTASWLDSLKMENIAATYYANIFNALQSPSVIKTRFNLSVVELSDWDFTRPVYISQFNAYYYLNKINQFKVNNLTQLELVRISYVATEAINPPDPPPPTQYKAHIIFMEPNPAIFTVYNLDVNGGTPVSPVGFATLIAGDTINMRANFTDQGVDQWNMRLRNVDNGVALGTWALTSEILRTESVILNSANLPLWDGGDVEYQVLQIPI